MENETTNTEEVVDQSEVVEPVEKETATEEDYSWVPKKFIKNGEPDLQGLAKSYQSLEKRMGSKSLASDSIEDYVFNASGNFTYDPEVSNAFKTEAQKMGLSPEQYAWAMEKYEASVSGSIVTADVAEKDLRSTWGKNFDANLNAARAAWDTFAPSDMDINEVGNNTAVLKLLARIGAELGEDKPSNRGATRPTAMSEEQINEIIKSKDYRTDLKKQEIVRTWYEKQYG